MAEPQPELHPQLTHVSRLLGTWSGRGHGEYPTIESFDYAETVTFTHVGKPFLRYEQRTRRIEPDGSLGTPLHAETGYWRFPAPGSVEVILSHPTGVNEVEEGTIAIGQDGATLIATASTAIGLSTTAKSVTSLERTFRLHGDTLDYTLHMAAVGRPLQHHLAATLTRQPLDPLSPIQ